MGFIASPELCSVAKNEFVNSVFYTSDTFKSVKQYNDLSFSRDEEVAGWNEDVEKEFGTPPEWKSSLAFISNFLSAAEIASLKKASFAKYYIPTLITMVRSTNFTTIRSTEKTLEGTPATYRKIVQDSVLRKNVSSLKGITDVQCAILDTALSQLSSLLKGETQSDLEAEEINDTIHHLSQFFLKIPKFKSNLQYSKPAILSPTSKDILLESLATQ